MSSLSQPNQPGLTSPLKWTPQPTNCRSTNAPSLICSVGLMTALKSIWPQGCGMYQAIVKSGDGVLNGLPVLARVVQVCAPVAAAVAIATQVKVGLWVV